MFLFCSPQIPTYSSWLFYSTDECLRCICFNYHSVCLSCIATFRVSDREEHARTRRYFAWLQRTVKNYSTVATRMKRREGEAGKSKKEDIQIEKKSQSHHTTWLGNRPGFGERKKKPGSAQHTAQSPAFSRPAKTTSENVYSVRLFWIVSKRAHTGKTRNAVRLTKRDHELLLRFLSFSANPPLLFCN